MTSSSYVVRVAASLTIAVLTVGSVGGAPLVRSKHSGAWSAKETWDAERVPKAGDRVVIRAGHTVSYDSDSREVIRLVQIAGKLEFVRDRNTRLEVGLIALAASEEPLETGNSCAPQQPGPPGGGQSRPSLLIGKPGSPIPAEHTATIRLHYISGMDKASCPAIVNCGGLMEVHGAALQSTWVKLKTGSGVGAVAVAVEDVLGDWKVGDQVIVVGTKAPREGIGGADGSDYLTKTQTEARRIARIEKKDATSGSTVTFDKPLTYAHFADGDFRTEVANLSRNVVVESADPDGFRGHTVVHRHSAGSISYAEFRHLGKRDESGRHPLNFSECGGTMRGSSVVGCSIWDSHNRFLAIRGTDGLVVRDNVGYKSVGHGFFLEDGTEVNNIIDHNLSVLVGPGKSLPKQVVPFDLNRGAGFWWANCQNQFTRNVAAECAESGYSFECKRTAEFDPVRPIRQAGGTLAKMDTRVVPFIRFQDNEAHSMRYFGLSLRGAPRPAKGGLDVSSPQKTLAKEAAAALPVTGKPFWVRDFRVWESNMAVHLGTAGVLVDGLDVCKSDTAIWRSIMEGSGFRRMTTKEMRVNDIHNPLSMGWPVGDESHEPERDFTGVSSFRDDLPPVTLVTSAVRHGSLVRVRGSVADASDIKQVHVNGKPARSTRDRFAEWEVTLVAPANQRLEVSAVAEDVKGNVEQHPHTVLVD